jgi:hypothetical protein
MRKSRIAIIGTFLTSFVFGCGAGGGVTDTSPIPKSPYAPTEDQWAAMRGGMSKASKRAHAPKVVKGVHK